MDTYRMCRGKIQCLTVNVQKYRSGWKADVTVWRRDDNRIYFNATPSSVKRAQRAQLATIERATWCDVCSLPAEHCRENH